MQHLDEGLLQAWLDRERSGLTAAELAEIERHLAECDACARKLDALRDSSRRVEALLGGSADASESIPSYADIRARAEGDGSRPRRRSVWVTMGWAASVAVALGAGWMANEMYRQDRLPPAVTEGVESAETARAGAPVPEQVADAETTGDAEAARPSAPPPAESRADAGMAEPAAERVAEAAPGPPPTAPEESVTIAATTFEDEPLVTVRGRVTDESGRPLEAAEVVVEGAGVGTLTGADGTFEIAMDRPNSDAAGEVTLTARRIGFTAESRALTLSGDDSAAVDFHLGTTALALQELVVAGEQAPTAPAALDAPVAARQAKATGGSVWRTVSRADAEAEVGFAIVTIPERPVTEVSVATVGAAAFVRVVQRLAGDGAVELVESRSPIPPELATAPEGQARVTLRRGSLYVSATAPMSREALEELVQSLR